MPVSVLLVDGDSSHSQGLVRALADAWLGWRVDVALTVADALQRLAAGGIDVIVAAEQLVDGSAFDVLEVAQEIPVILAVPENGAARAARALRHGFRDFIVRDEEHAYLLSLPAQIEEVLEQSCTLLTREACQTLQARQHRLLNAMSRAQSLFIDGQACAAFTVLLQELLTHTSSPCGFLACVRSSGEADAAAHARRDLRLLAQAGQWPDGRAAPDMGEEWTVLAPACPAGSGSAGVLARALVSRSLVVHNPGASACPSEDWPDGRSVTGTCCAQALWGGDEPVLLLLLAGRTSGYAAELPRALQPVLSTLVQMAMAQRAQAARLSVEAQLARTTALLVEKTQVLESTLDFMDQGITNVNAEGRICVFNRRYLELLEMTEDFMSRQPKVEEVVRYQAARGDFGSDFEYVDDRGRDYMRREYAAQGLPLQTPASYVRRTHTGRHVEVRTRHLPDGGRVRSFTDVTDFIATQEALRSSEARWRSLTQLSSDWYWEVDSDFRFVRVEGANRLLTGLEATDLMGKTPWQLPDFGMSEESWQAYRARLLAREVFHDLEVQYGMPDGSTLWVWVSGEPFYSADGSFLGYRGVGRNVSDRKRAEAEIERLAFFDELTGLPNRRLLMDRMERVLATGVRTGQYGALLFLDLDNFKGINDTLGHEWGDQLLQQAALRLSGSVRASDTVARLGGDEFVVVLAGLPDNEAKAVIEVRAIGQKLLGRLNQPYLLDGREIHNTASVGTALFHGREETTHDLLKRADLAMYQAKAQGRNTLCFFDPQMQATANARSALEADIRLGLQRAEFLPHYQPVVDADGRVLGAEALVRWRHPQRGMVPPYEFIHVAEQTGLIMPLGQLMLRTACLQLAAWSQRPETAEWTVSVNVSAHEFRHPDFVQQVAVALQESGASPRRLKIELTESLLLHDVEDAIAKMQELRTQGVGFSLDDFGTGYSSLAYLKRLPLDQLKIDQSFVRDVLTDPNDAAIACTIVALANSLGLDVVAEGVETEGQREFLLRNGCRRFQGYLFGRPAPAEQLLAA